VESISVSESDILQYLFDDPDTSIISLYIKDPSEEFIETLKKNAGKKPVLYKNVGKVSFSKDLENFAIEVQNYIELFEFAKVFLWCPEPKGTSLGIIGPSSGAIHLLISEMRNTGLHLAKLDPDTKRNILNNVGGSTCMEGNPIDYWPPTKFIGAEICKIYYKSSNLLLQDDTVDALFLALEFFSEIEFDFDVFEQVKKKFPNKPIIAILIQAEKEGRERIIETATELRIPVFVDEVERAIRAYSALYKYFEYKRNKIKK
jgi:acyl-CoA synthetase (NDP forming)